MKEFFKHLARFVLSYVCGTFLGGMLGLPLAMMDASYSGNEFLVQVVFGSVLAVSLGWLYGLPSLLIGLALSWWFVRRKYQNIWLWLISGMFLAGLNGLILPTILPVFILSGFFISFFMWRISRKVLI